MQVKAKKKYFNLLQHFNFWVEKKEFYVRETQNLWELIKIWSQYAVFSWQNLIGLKKCHDKLHHIKLNGHYCGFYFFHFDFQWKYPDGWQHCKAIQLAVSAVCFDTFCDKYIFYEKRWLEGSFQNTT